MSLKKKGLGNRPHRSTGVEPEEEEQMWNKGVLGSGSPFSLIFTIWYFFTLLLGLRGRDEHRHLTFGDIVLLRDINGCERLEMSERGSKTRDGGVRDDSRPTKPKIFCSCSDSGPERCIVEIFKLYVSRRPTDFCHPDHPMYLQFKPDRHINAAKNSYWYKREPLGVNSLGKMLPKACEMAEIPRRGNHGVRATTVQRLRAAKVPDDKIIQVTGHRSIRTLGVYDTESLQSREHHEMQSILQREKPSTALVPVGQSASATSHEVASVAHTVPAIEQSSQSGSLVCQKSTTATTGIFSGAVFNQCVFHLHSGDQN